MPSRWKPLDIKAMEWYCDEKGCTLEVPFAWPHVVFVYPNGYKESKPIEHIRRAYLQQRKKK